MKRLCSAQRIRGLEAVFARKTYLYQTPPPTPVGHLVHWLYVAHLRALFTKAARDLGVALSWAQSVKHKNAIPDALVAVGGTRYAVEVDNSTERMKSSRIAGKLGAPAAPPLLCIAFRSEARFRNLAARGGEAQLFTWHGYFHGLEDAGFNILTAPVWWDGHGWRALL